MTKSSLTFTVDLVQIFLVVSRPDSGDCHVRDGGVHSTTCHTHTFFLVVVCHRQSACALLVQNAHTRKTLTFIHVPSALSVVPVWSCRCSLSHFTVSLATDADASAIRADAFIARESATPPGDVRSLAPWPT